MIITVINQRLDDNFRGGGECLKGHLAFVGHLVDFTSDMQNILLLATKMLVEVELASIS